MMMVLLLLLLVVLLTAITRLVMNFVGSIDRLID